MRRVFVTQEFSELRYVQSLLGEQHIDFVTKNEHLMGTGSAAGEVPPFFCPMEIWIADDQKEEEIAAMIQRSLKAPRLVQASWRCQTCGEEMEGQFSACWKCAAPDLSSAMHAD
ncbi:DUF2007 domain-containing protein [Sulfidibacter corallicola]|uniref:DUF2007 domain-containing protein n=1 Tax=Sulfidibacter corallicola TaxID=2818388 RepID=A0A8A4TE17_SULCO|nr:DUF2007 domain-containing protein [Sulfidibacter corallicola]QTD47810.1 DUF2007 domain-containing protein [Sulfidibacter corallicola]